MQLYRKTLRPKHGERLSIDPPLLIKAEAKGGPDRMQEWPKDDNPFRHPAAPSGYRWPSATAVTSAVWLLTSPKSASLRVRRMLSRARSSVDSNL